MQLYLRRWRCTTGGRERWSGLPRQGRLVDAPAHGDLQLDTSHEGAYRYIQRRPPAPVWLVRRKREEEAAAAIGADISSVRPTDSNIGALPPEVRLRVCVCVCVVSYGACAVADTHTRHVRCWRWCSGIFLSRGEDLVCAGLVSSQWHAIPLDPALWRRLCGFHLARVFALLNNTDVDEPPQKMQATFSSSCSRARRWTR
jgi:hypothetical protein